jgi:hypothetical protein
MERHYDAYLLRWWHSDGGERVEVQHVQTGEQTTHPSLTVACTWLLTQYGHFATDTLPAQHDERRNQLVDDR